MQGDVDRVIDAAKAIALPIDRKVLHVLPQEYILDNQDGIKNPIGISGVRLEAEVHIVTSALTSAQNIVRSVERLASGVGCRRLPLSYNDIYLYSSVNPTPTSLRFTTLDNAIFEFKSVQWQACTSVGCNSFMYFTVPCSCSSGGLSK